MAVFIVSGLRRSGNHAILSWLMGMLPHTCHLNDLPPKLCRMELYELMARDDLPATPSRIRADRQWIPFPKSHTLIISLESHETTSVRRCLERFPDATKVVILRTADNALASAHKAGYNLQTYKRLWQSYVAERHHLGTTALFDLWLTNSTYRRRLAAALGVDFNDNQFCQRIKWGTSSFTSATKDDMLRRAEEFAADSDFQNAAVPLHPQSTQLVEEERAEKMP